MKQKIFRLIDHTADLGMEVFGRDLPALYANAGMALFDLLVHGQASRDYQQYNLRIRGEDRADLMVNWLRELLYFWNGRQQIVRQLIIRALSETVLEAEVMATDYDPDCHRILREIKAVTYHRIAVETRKAGWRARVFFDL